MFNKEETKFINETAERDLNAVNAKIEHVCNELARYGKNLGDLKIVQSHLLSILEAIKEEKEEKEESYDGCQQRCY